MDKSPWPKLQKSMRNSTIVVLSIAMAIVIFLTPLQAYFSISRLQHYGLALFLVGLGYVLQVIWSWRSLKTWTRLAQLASGVFLASVAVVLYANPWLEAKMGVRTESQEHQRTIILRTYALLAIPVIILCLLWIKEELQSQKLKTKRNTLSHKNHL